MGIVDEINRLTKTLDATVGKYIDLSKKKGTDSVKKDEIDDPTALDSSVFRSLLEKWHVDTRAELRRNRSTMISRSKHLLNEIMKTENTSDRQRLLYEYIKLHDPVSVDAAQYAKPLEALAHSTDARRASAPALPVSDLAECRSTVRAAPFFVTKKDLRDLLLRRTKLTATEVANLSRDDMCKILFARSLEDAESNHTQSKNLA